MATTEEDKPIEMTAYNSSQLDSEAFANDNWEDFPTFNDLRSKVESVTKIETSFRTKVQYIIDSIWVQTFIVLLVIFDLIIGLTTIISNEQTKSIITLIIIILYCIEIIFRIYAYGFIKYFTSILDIIDFIAVLGSLILYIYAIYVLYTLLVKILRWIRVLRTTYRAIFSRGKKIQKAIRQLQRSNLKGYRDEKYDLDIAYITDDILIMSRPTTKVINQFSHDALSDIKQFLDEKHKNSYRIFDLCVYDDINHDNYHYDSRQSKELILSSINIDISDGANIEYNTFGPQYIVNDFAFRGSTVLSLDKLFEFTEEATKFIKEKSSNVIIIQSTAGLGRAMFMTAALLFYYYPNTALSDIIKFIHNERISSSNHLDLFSKFLPSQMRYYRYFSTLISHCYKLAASNHHIDDDIDDDINDDILERNLSIHIEKIHHNHQESVKIDGNEYNSSYNSFNSYNSYNCYAMDMLNSKIGVVIKHIAIYNYFDEIDPYINWEADIFKWKDSDNETLRCIEYDTFKYGLDSEPGANSALIKRFKDIKPMVLEKDFGIRIYKSFGNTADDRKGKRKLMGQLILHSHFINLDENQCITFKKNEIDFVHKDVNNKHFPADFHIVVRAKILRKKV